MVLGVLHFAFCGYSKILLQRMKETLSLTTIDSRLTIYDSQQHLGHSRAEIAADVGLGRQVVALHVEEPRAGRCGEIRPARRVKKIAIKLKTTKKHQPIKHLF
jgi:hypothetical protein